MTMIEVKPVERVACVERRRIPWKGLWKPTGELEALSPHVAFLPRDKHDPGGIESESGLGRDWLQVVAYLVPVAGASVFVSNRAKGSDPRLEGRLTIAFGGHVNLGDVDEWDVSRIDLEETVLDAAYREAREEAPVLATVDGQVRGLIRLDEGPIDRVHLGVVVGVRLPHCVPVLSSDASVEPIGWMRPAEALERHPGRFESWSEVILRNLAGSGTPIL